MRSLVSILREDRHALFATLIFTLGTLLDTITTSFLPKTTGLAEANPVIRIVLGHTGGAGVLLFKLLAFAFLATLILRVYPEKYRRPGFIVAAYTCGVIWLAVGITNSILLWT